MSTTATAFSNHSAQSGTLVLKAVIIYDNLAFVAQTSTTLQRVGRQTNANVRWRLVRVSVNTLNKAAVVQERSLAEALDAQLIVIPIHYACNLPDHLRDWLDHWALLREIQDSALAAVDNGVHDFTCAVSSELTLLVQKHGLNLIVDERSVTKTTTKLTDRLTHNHELPRSLRLRRANHMATRNLFRSFGINE